ncbi:hypothetical protein [Pseudoduganella lutea]|uniref:Yip1 domain-containing protein n=1 Tax=Pseudoduganella lutea TaxID=321985 RepID=A0A4P6L0Y9_9BURK|nr:hypothetical protein [Pseudoduganella lutea]QBE64924.1 hypothetical protein EWM63_19600 [Pseudoduganella lutea]
MTDKYYQQGRRNGVIPYGLEHGSDAYTSAFRGVQDHNDEMQEKQAEAYRKGISEPQTHAFHVPSSLDNNQAVQVLGLLAVIAIGFAFSTLFSVTERWNEYQYPYKIVALFYYVLLTLPITGFASIWTAIIHKLFDGYSLWSVPIAVAAEFVYFFLLITVAMLLYQLIKKLRVRLSMLLAPAVFALLWYLGDQFL